LKRARGLYAFFLLGVVVLLALAAVPIAASDLFRQPYSPAWNTVYDVLDLFEVDPWPTGGGAPPRFPYWRNPADAFIYYRSVTLTTADGVNLAAWYIPAASEGPASAQPTIVLAHGLLDRKETMLNLVPWLHEAGYHVMMFDFRGHGNSDKRPTTIGREEALDVQAALDWLEAEGVGGSIGGLGMSLGAAALVNAAAQDPRLDALVLDSLFADWSDTDFARDYRLPPDWLVPDVPSPVELMPDIHVPVFIIHGTADILTGVSHARRLYDAANAPKKLWINDSGHAWSAWTYPQLYRQKVLDFFAASLP
jgi:dipeptidyl aminopeptidase/acylaminoacyl peptidase